MIDFVGKKIGRVTVLKEVSRKIFVINKKRRVYRRFLCKCDCGQTRKFMFAQLNKERKTELMCTRCMKRDFRRRKKEREEKNKSPVLHTCGEEISKHKRCKSCDVILCEEGLVKEYKNNYCKKCYENYVLQKKVERE